MRISRGFGVHYLPLYVMEAKGLLQKQAAANGLGDIKVEYFLVDGGNHINDAMLAGSLDIASTGTGGFLTLWAKAKGNPKLEVIGLGGSASGGMTMTTRNPAIKSLRDVTETDRIAVPGIKTSLGAIILQMAAAKEFGDKDYARLDHLTVSMSYPDAVAAMISGKSQITAHVASAPFSYMELDSPGIHKVFNSVELFGHVTTIMAFTSERFRAANPKMTAAFVAALKEAVEFVAANKQEAAQIYRQRRPGQVAGGRDPAHHQRSGSALHAGARRGHDLRQFHAARRLAQGEAGDMEGCVRERAARPSGQLTERRSERCEVNHATEEAAGRVHARRHVQGGHLPRPRLARLARRVGADLSVGDRLARPQHAPAQRHGRRRVLALQGVRDRPADPSQMPTSTTPSPRC